MPELLFRTCKLLVMNSPFFIPNGFQLSVL
jgi:hypothetical protein